MRRGVAVVVLAAMVLVGCAAPVVQTPTPTFTSPTFPWLLWTMHMGTTLNAFGNPYHWQQSGKPPMSLDDCRAALKGVTVRRFVTPVQWYIDPKDSKTWWGCLPDGFDPEEAPK